MTHRGKADRRIDLLTKATLRARAAARGSQGTRMKIEERVAEIQATIEAILADASGWPPGNWDSPLKRLEATVEAIMMTDQELAELSAEYRIRVAGILGPISQALMIEVARRSTLTAHQRLAEAVERRRLRAC